jgi:radical SAM protein with 4Fe4S-binding SPASM domain
MIGFTKLLCGTATISQALKNEGKNAPHLLQFSPHNQPVVVWNLTNRCNLKCRHCYLSAEDRDYSRELTTTEAKAFIDDLVKMEVPILIFSGGEPLARKDIFQLGEYAAGQGLRVVISSNGTLITEEVAGKLKESGFLYVGVSLDGLQEIHDKFRGIEGAFEGALKGIRNSLQAGIKTGIRFTASRLNYRELPNVLDLVVREGITRFCLYHLVYSGRGKELVESDLSNEERREMISFLTEKTLDYCRRGVDLEILTVDNNVDGIFIYRYLKENMPERAEEVRELLRMQGGCSAGRKICSISPEGDIYLCQFWRHKSLGNVREQALSKIWKEASFPLLRDVRNKLEHIRGRCGECRYKEMCSGCRVRAEVVNNDVWGADPACYLTQEEITDAREQKTKERKI